MRPIRVALLSTVVDFGGIEGVLLNMLQHMDQGVEFVPVLYTRSDLRETSFLDRVRGLGVRHHTFYMDRSRLKYLNPVRNIAETIALFRRERFDLIHSHGYRANLIGLVVARWFGLPVVSTCHGFISNDRRLRAYNRLDVSLLRRFTRVIAVSSTMRDQLVEQGLDAERVRVVANAVAAASSADAACRRRQTRERLGIGDEEFVFGYLGRLSEEKGVVHLLRAAAAMPPGGRPWRVVVVGDGPNRPALEEAVRELGVEKHVIFAGFQSDTSAWYPAFDAFVLPSLTEGTPVALLEAMVHRLPVVATRVGGVPAVIKDRQNGLLVAPADPGALAGAMRAFAEDSSLGRTLGTAAHDWVQERHDIRSWVRDTRDVYAACLTRASLAS
jgi:glycosyltransferase involved in cell wall biosynthesis